MKRAQEALARRGEEQGYRLPPRATAIVLDVSGGDQLEVSIVKPSAWPTSDVERENDRALMQLAEGARAFIGEAISSDGESEEPS